MGFWGFGFFGFFLFFFIRGLWLVTLFRSSNVCCRMSVPPELKMKVSTTGKWVWSPALQCCVSFPSFWMVRSSTVALGRTTRLKSFVPTKHRKAFTLEDAIQELPITFSQKKRKKWSWFWLCFPAFQSHSFILSKSF